MREVVTFCRKEESMEVVAVFFGLIVLGFFAFMIYYVYKQIQFFLTATDLYKTMIQNQQSIIKLLLDIRDGEKNAEISEIEKPIVNGERKVEISEIDNPPEKEVETGAEGTVRILVWKCDCETLNFINATHCHKCHAPRGDKPDYRTEVTHTVYYDLRQKSGLYENKE